MKRTVLTSAILVILLMSAAACSNFLEDSIESIVPRTAPPYTLQPAEQVVLADIDELREYLHELIVLHDRGTIVQYISIDDEDLEEKASSVAQEILQTNPIAAYAVESIEITATQFVAHYELTIEIEYKRTLEQVQAIGSPISTQRFMAAQLLEILSAYRDEAVFLTNMQLDAEIITGQVEEIYYQNPRRIVMMPFVTTVDVFPDQNALSVSSDGQSGGKTAPDESGNKIYEIRFEYMESSEMLREIGGNLSTSIRQNAARADGDTDSEIVLSLVQNLIASTEYDEGTARTIAMHGQQNIATTAFGALVRGSAVGEGFAMAFKALCDELRLDCRIALGFYGDIYHAWNIVQLYGQYYHIDVAMSAVHGLEAGFLKTDEDFSELYAWDTERLPRCNGTLTLDDLIPPEIPPEDPDPNDPNDPNNPENQGNE